MVHATEALLCEENKSMRVILNALIIGYTLFFIRNGRLLIFLLRTPFSGMYAGDFRNTRPHLYMKVSGIMYGQVERYGRTFITFESASLNGEVQLAVDSHTKVIGVKHLHMGQQVCVYGRMREIEGRACIVPTKIICTNKEVRIRMYLDRSLTLCLAGGIIVSVICMLLQRFDYFGARI